MELTICSAKVTGRSHIKSGINCQDNLKVVGFVFQEKQYVVGVIADGCSEGTNSEVGSALAVHFIVWSVRQLILEGVELEHIPIILYQRVVDFLRDIVKKHRFPSARLRTSFYRVN